MHMELLYTYTHFKFRLFNAYLIVSHFLQINPPFFTNELSLLSYDIQLGVHFFYR
jgi:hypothetical protein